MSNSCSKCNGTGWYEYDHNHAVVCDQCCKHDRGWWMLTEQHGPYIVGLDNRCCKAGCGAMLRDLKSDEETQ